MPSFNQGEGRAHGHFYYYCRMEFSVEVGDMGHQQFAPKYYKKLSAARTKK